MYLRSLEQERQILTSINLIMDHDLEESNESSFDLPRRLLTLEDDDPTYLEEKPRQASSAWALLTSFRPYRPIFRASRLSIFKCLLRLCVGTILTLMFLSICHGTFRTSYSNPPEQYRDLEAHVSSSTYAGRANAANQKIFIAANIIDEELIRGHWGKSLMSLVDVLGPSNVFVSVYENDSNPGTSAALRDLGDKLPCNSSIVAGAHLSLDDFPAMRLPDGEERVQRITYLAEIRNRLLRPLDPIFAANTLAHEPGFKPAIDIRFDRVLFLNDIFFSSVEAAHLLFNTNGGNYRSACAVDFIRKVQFYDTFVVRDNDGYGTGLMMYPWFSGQGSRASRSDVLAQKDAVRVRSCWGGMAAFDAKIFQTQPKTANTAPNSASISMPSDLFYSDNLFAPSLSTLNTPTRPLPNPLLFRSSSEPFWEAAECCLIFADIEECYGPANPSTDPLTTSLLHTNSFSSDIASSKHNGVYLNPYVRVAYSEATWRWLPFVRRFERAFEMYQRIATRAGPWPEYNPRRTHQPGQLINETIWVTDTSSSDLSFNVTVTEFDVDAYLDHMDTNPGAHGIHISALSPSPLTFGHWATIERPAPVGGFCGQRKMFVMKNNLKEANSDGSGKNWDKITIPAPTIERVMGRI